MKQRRIADIASSWTVVLTTPGGETVAAGNWPHGDEAHDWARDINIRRLARVRAVLPLVPATDLITDLVRGEWT
ncbi:hypothetical protein SAMN05421835_108183 [Amycolatopsis sacchari]|uniref:Uncharacterized protein n=1 Tax=Amycolatopsis sacchari TaxID=115433 RepID=A0A1I3U257_9PSEU|nr:hypothetical protein [Amycolatopsis sacchari]SFJ76609.1 hypothetical protein SAMN05421835_108183 [Amycolatopsis sacchari]